MEWKKNDATRRGRRESARSLNLLGLGVRFRVQTPENCSLGLERKRSKESPKVDSQDRVSLLT